MICATNYGSAHTASTGRCRPKRATVSRRTLKRKRSIGTTASPFENITTLVIGQVMSGLEAIEPGGRYPKALLLKKVEQLFGRIQVNISNKKNSPAYVAGDTFFGKLSKSLSGARNLFHSASAFVLFIL